MIKKISALFAVLAFVVGGALLVPAGAYAANALDAQCAGNADIDICKPINKDATPESLAKTITNILLFVVGAISVLMIIIGGIMYVTSAGDAGNVTKAKNTIMYAVIGLVASFLAFAIVQFVVTKFV